MVAITRIIAGEEPPYGLFHLTHTPLEVLREKGLRANALAEYTVHKLIGRLQERIAPASKDAACRFARTHEDYYPLELSLWEQLSIAPPHYSGVLLSLTQDDALLGLNETSEPNRKLRAMIQFSRKFAPEALESIARFHDGDTAHALDILERATKTPWHLLRLREQPSLEDGFFSLLAQPFLEVNGILRSYDRGPDLRPEARAIWFNGNIPFECFEVLPLQPGRAP
ncbi:hypothetical protein [Paraburkholderia lycopersici]|uniref:Uncharacterized protein n=1 Tax=Paraburkholderia lycopersici TaxID=416944 RepID=A0A1G6M0P3_9BURK|nr:hypothetical protein [Paraburkholderia lycopersici]SDC49039.1 hypothetical protein SAMN05421548_10795 [Paraburkholderia lycopersici]